MYPEKRPFNSLSVNNQKTLGTKAKPPIVKVMTKLALTIIGLRPYWSASRPHTGAIKAEAKADKDTARPAYHSTLFLGAPSSSTYKAINGITSEKLAPVKKLPSQATRKFCFQLTSLLMIVHLLFKKSQLLL